MAYGGDLAAAAVRVYAANYSDSGIAADIRLTIEQGRGGVFGAAECTDDAGFTVDPGDPVYDGRSAGFAAKTTFAQGTGSWTPVTAGSKVYRFRYELLTSAASAQSASAQLDFVWEARNI